MMAWQRGVSEMRLLLPLFLLLLQCPLSPHAMLYAPPQGSIWDPSCLRIGGQTHCVFMYISSNGTANSLHGGYPSGLLASANDGVHFRTVGQVAFEQWEGVGFFKAFVSYIGPDPAQPDKPLFVMNHGTEGNTTDRPPRSASDPGCPYDSQCLRWLRSNDMLNWSPMYTNSPDPRWYLVSGGGAAARWDAASMMPDPAGRGWLAFPTASVPGRINCGLGLMRSPDGVSNWSAVAPPSYDWGALGRGTSMEIGGVEKIGDRYFVIGGTGNAGYEPYPVQPPYRGSPYSMYVLSSASPGGPYTPRPASFRLSGVTQIPAKRETFHSLGAWVHDYDSGEHLMSNYIMSSNIYMTPLKRPIADEAGNLRLTWWEGNEKLKGPPIQDFPSTLSVAAPTDGSCSKSSATVWLPAPGPTWNHTVGIVVTGMLTVTRARGTTQASVGFGFEAVEPSQWAPTVRPPSHIHTSCAF